MLLLPVKVISPLLRNNSYINTHLPGSFLENQSRSLPHAVAFIIGICDIEFYQLSIDYFIKSAIPVGIFPPCIGKQLLCFLRIVIVRNKVAIVEFFVGR